MSDTNAGDFVPRNPTRDARVHEIFLEVIALPEEHRRTRLDEVGREDSTLLSAVEQLLDADLKSTGFLKPPLEQAVCAGTMEVTARRPHGNESDADDPLLGQMIGGFLIDRRIGEGGMGIVYAATEERPRRTVAVKIVRDTLFRKGGTRRLEFEAETLSRLQHANIAQVFAAGLVPGSMGKVPYFAMEYVEGGQPITTYAKERGLTVDQRLRLYLDVCAAVQHGHERGVIHRDLKPSNVLVSLGGLIKVIDFGVARVIDADARQKTLLTETGAVIGTLQYMSPEQSEGSGASADSRSDVYSLGAILYELVCDLPAFDLSTRSLEESLRAIRESQPVHPRRRNPHIDHDLAAIVLKTLMKDRGRRYAGVSELSADLGRYLAKEPIAARPASATYFASLFVRRNPLLAVLFCSLIFTMVSATAVSTSLYWRASKQSVLAQIERDDAVDARHQAEAVRQFIQDMLASVDPENARGEQVSMSDVLTEAALTVERELSDQPQVEAAIHVTIGRTYLSLGQIAVAEGHLKRALELRTQSLRGDHPDVVDSLAAMAELRMADRRYEEALELQQRVLSIETDLFGHESTAVARSLGNLGFAYTELGHRSQAEDSLRESLALCRRLEARPAQIAHSLNNLGTFLAGQADYAGAEIALREAVALRREHLGDNHPGTAVALSSLAHTIAELGKLDQARILMEESLAVRRRAYGDQHPKVAVALNALGLHFSKRGDYVSAEPYLRQALAMRREVLRPDHPGVAVSLHNLALLLGKLGQYEDSRNLLGESLELRRQIYGSEHLRVAAGLHSLAGVSRKLGDLTGAEAHARDALEMSRRLLDADHPTVLAFMNSLAVILKNRAKLDEAASLYREVVKLRRRRFGENHVQVAVSEVNLALLLVAQGDLEDAEPLARQALSTMRSVYGNEHVDVAWALHALGSILMLRDDYEGAEEILNSALAIQRETLPAAHPDTARTLKSLAKLSMRQLDPTKAEERIRESLAMLRQTLPAGHWRIADGESILGACLSRQGLFEEAEVLLVESYGRIAIARGESEATSVDARARITALYEAWGKPKEAEKWRAGLEADTMPNSSLAP